MMMNKLTAFFEKVAAFAIIIFMVGCAASISAEPDKKGQTMNPLNPEEERVIVHKGTESPFSGEYWNFTEKGTYVCRRCGAPLYRSSDKFDSRCGWPSFDDEIPGAVKRQPDMDGKRTEIICSKCGAHLGHVFEGELLTQKDTRHCVNSVSLKFVSAASEVEKDSKNQATDRAIFAGGCFWGVEHYLRKAPGVLSTRVGYTGGSKEHPTYEEVCSGHTGHLEAVEVIFDPSKTSYEEVAKLFFEIHDPTQVDGQGPDIGEQYHSAFFYLNDEQKSVAERLIRQLASKGYAVATEVRPAGKFWPAEDYHQQYYEKKGTTPYCHVYKKRF
jgi:peptide methionine sulfoxide reductase msrA/msrB